MRTSPAARMSFMAAATFMALLLLLHVLKPDLDPSWRFISEYAIGAHGWIMRLAFLTWALSCGALAIALTSQARTTGGKAGLVVLLIVAVALVVAGLFAQDPLTAKPDEFTTHGKLHARASMVGIPGLPIAAVLVSWSLARRNPSWAPARTSLLWTAHLTWISLVAMFVYLGVAVPRAGGFGPSVLAGWLNRLVVLTHCVWLMTAGWHAARLGRAVRAAAV